MKNLPLAANPNCLFEDLTATLVALNKGVQIILTIFKTDFTCTLTWSVQVRMTLRSFGTFPSGLFAKCPGRIEA